MERERTTSDSGRAPGQEPALGDVARDVIDHAAMIARDAVEIGKLEARHYVEHLRHDVAARVAWSAAAVVMAATAAIFGLIALFLGIASVIGSVAWTFVIFGALFAVVAVAIAAVAARPPRADQMSRYPTGGSTSLAALDAPRKT